jgi:isoleucyl-tRNA synthetase
MYNSEKNEKEILAYWDEHKCFEKSVSSRPADNPYDFYDGPPFATGLPHYGHIVASLMKDVVPRFWTMRGKRVERKWGWDCHGLPVENIIEQELDLKSKREIEEYGVGKFNEACRATVLKYADEWKKTIHRMGRWVDMEHDYKTMDISFMESVWWVFKELWDKKLIYKGHKAMHICPRCVTPLSNFEVTQGYKDIKDISVTVKFKLKSGFKKIQTKGDVFVLAWTTTPWTLPGNVLLAVGEEIKYVLVKTSGDVEENLILAKDRLEAVMKDKKYEILSAMSGADLVGLEYEPLFPYFKDTPNAFRIVSGAFVTTEDGTGVVHIAPAFGEDDYQVGIREMIPLIQHVTMEGRFIPEVTDFAGQEVKPKDDPTAMDVEILKWLAARHQIFDKAKFEHSYPHCWRCDTPLLNYATASWFVKVTELKDQLLKNNEAIRWVPEHIKYGRFGLWLEGARDWAISRNRYWGTPLPVWECRTEKCGNFTAVGSVEELEKMTGEKIADLHKHKIDGLIIKCDECGGDMKRIPEVLDCWFESGSMPYGQMHYPFENKAKFEAGFPAEFIAEGQDQTRGWFYTLHVLATALTSGRHPSIPVKKSGPAFKNVIVNGIVLAEDGKKMSKRLKNYPEPEIILEKYGADAMRYYLLTSPVMEAEALNFTEAGVRETYNKLVNTIWNVLEFYKMFAPETGGGDGLSDNELDKWILAKLQILIAEVTAGVESYKLVSASRPILDFITELSQWYVRRSRDRFKGSDKKDALFAVQTLKEVLLTLAKVMAPFTPFIAEKIYMETGGKKESVHLEDWPEAGGKKTDLQIIKNMDMARKIVEMGLSVRSEQGIKVRQPLKELVVAGAKLSDGLALIIAEELNVKEVVFAESAAAGDKWKTKEEGELLVSLDVEITEELKKEGLARELVRTINQIRKEQKLTPADVVSVYWQSNDETIRDVLANFSGMLKDAVKAKDFTEKEKDGMQECEVGEGKIKLLLFGYK